MIGEQTQPLTALVVDDEQPARDELVYLLSRDPRIGEVLVAKSGAEALKVLESGTIELLFLDIAMPGLSGIDIARVVAQFRVRPHIVFVTAHDAHAVEAFELGAVDYLLKPIREERLTESIRRAAQEASSFESADDTITVELGGVTRFVQRSHVTHAEASGDYVRLHMVDGTSHLIRTALSVLEIDWQPFGFVRIHRSILVSLDWVHELRQQSGRTVVVVQSGDSLTELTVSRRHSRAVRELLVNRR